MLVTLKALFIVICYRVAVAQDRGNGSSPQPRNNSEASATVLREINATEPKTDKNIHTVGKELSSAEMPTRMNKSFPFAVNISFHEQNKLFFSTDFKARLAAMWENILQNASMRCVKTNYAAIPKIEYPVFGVKENGEDRFSGFLPLETVKPVLVRRRKEHDIVTIAYMAILELWPLLVLCFSCAALAGILVWLLDNRSNPEEFPKRFWRGIFDGMWWAVVTMSTVGYGDKSPRSLLARLFAIVWIVAGIILLSMFTAQVSSRLITQELRSDDHLFGKKIGVPPGVYDSDYANYKMTYSIVEEIENETDLENSQLDSIMVFHCDGKPKTHWEVLQFLPACEIGAMVIFQIHPPSTEIDAELDYIKCMKMQMRMAQNYGKKSEGKKENKTKMHRSCNAFLEQLDNRNFQFKWVFFEDLSQYLVPFGAVIGSLVFVFVIGTIWECLTKRKKSGLESSQPSFTLQSSATEKEPMTGETSKC